MPFWDKPGFYTLRVLKIIVHTLFTNFFPPPWHTRVTRWACWFVQPTWEKRGFRAPPGYMISFMNNNIFDVLVLWFPWEAVDVSPDLPQRHSQRWKFIKYMRLHRPSRWRSACWKWRNLWAQAFYTVSCCKRPTGNATAWCIFPHIHNTGSVHWLAGYYLLILPRSLSAYALDCAVACHYWELPFLYGSVGGNVNRNFENKN